MTEREIGGEGKIRDFTDLHVWRLGMDLAERIYRLTWTFPQNEKFGISSQLQRAAVSIPSNIAEGHTRGFGREYVRYIQMARGSLAELRTQLLLSGRLENLPQLEVETLITDVNSLSKQLTSLRNKVEERLNQSDAGGRMKPQ